MNNRLDDFIKMKVKIRRDQKEKSEKCPKASQSHEKEMFIVKFTNEL